MRRATRRGPARPSPSWVGTVLREGVEAGPQESALRVGAGELERAAVGGGRFVAPVEPAQEIGARRVVQAVVVERSVRTGGLDGGEADRRAICHRDRGGAVELHDR